MRHAGLFSGIGGFSLAAQWMGWENVFDVEIDDWCRKVLHKNFPTTQLFDDVCTFDGLPFRGTIDVLSGGFPCQPFSAAGRGLGTADPRALWPQMLRIIREVRPRYVVGENVRGLLTRNPLQFEAVCADLEAEGYDVQPFLLPACGVEAIHRRDRFWFIAHARRSAGLGRESSPVGCVDYGPNAGRNESADFPSGLRKTGADSNAKQRGGSNHDRGGWRYTQPSVCLRNDGVSGRLVRPDRSRILKGAGNAIVPQAALQFFQAIQTSIL